MNTLKIKQETLESELSSALERAAKAAISLQSSKEEVCGRLMSKLKVEKSTEQSVATEGFIRRRMFNGIAGP
jgi:hypothetical protein